MNIAVINLKDIIKYIICFIAMLTIIAVVMLAIKDSSFIYCLKAELPLISINEEPKIEKANLDNSSEKILSSEFTIMYGLEEYSEIDDMDILEDVYYTENSENLESIEKTEENKNTQIAENLETQVISDNNIKESYTNEGQNVKVNNKTGFDITDILNNSNYEVTNKDKIIIYHTHTCESYTSSDAYKYEMTGSYRTTDLNYTVSRVGDELAKYLEESGKTVIHEKTYHDYPEYNGSYGRSLSTMEKVLEENKDAEIMIDLHRDAVRKQ